MGHYDTGYCWEPGDIVHVWNRGVRQDPLFRDRFDNEHFLKLMEKTLLGNDCRIESYCLMSNHYHIALSTGEIPLSKCIMLLQRAYARYFNTMYEYKGHAFESRYGARLIEDVNDLCHVSRYIHLNPVRANMVARPEDYRWSSYRGILGWSEDQLIDRERILANYAPGKSVEDFRRYTEKDTESRSG